MGRASIHLCLVNRTRNLSEVSQENGRMVRSVAFLGKHVNRTFIAQATGLTFPVVTKNVKELLSLGFLEPADRPETRKGSGRISEELKVNPSYGWALGIEIGPYVISATKIDATGAVISNHLVSSFLPTNYDEVLMLLVGYIEAEIGRTSKLPLGIGITSPGGREDNPGLLYRFDRPNWNGRAIEEDIASHFRVPVLLMNNVAAMALYFNLVSDLREGHYAFFFALKGIACVEFDHQKNNLYSTIARSGQVGHMIVKIHGDKCPSCGNRGCLESVSSETAVLDKCKKLLAQRGEDCSSFTIEDILKRRNNDSTYMSAVFQKALDYLAIAISNIQNYSPVRKMFIMSRMISTQREFLTLEQKIRSNLLATKDIKVEFQPITYSPYFGSTAAAFCLIYDRFVGIGKQLV